MLDPITTETTVDTTQDKAFDAVVRRIDAWWPMDPFSMAHGHVTIEPKLGGQSIETAADGARFVWGHVTAFDPPRAIGLAWYVGRTVDQGTHIAVTFDADDDGKTCVRLVHSAWEALGDEAAEVRTRYRDGWQLVLGTAFAGYIAQERTAGTQA